MRAMMPEIGTCSRRCFQGLREGLFILGLILLGAETAAAQACPACDAAELARWLAGSFEAQFEGADRANGADAESKEGSDNPLIDRLVVTPIRVREMGQRVFYFERQRGLGVGDPREGEPQEGERTVDSWLGLLEVIEDAIVLKVYLFHEPERFLGAYSDKARFRDLAWDDLRELPSEDTLWKRDGEAFISECGEEMVELSDSRVTSFRRVTRDSITMADPSDLSDASIDLGRVDD